MTCRVASDVVPCDWLSYRGLNFGQPVPGVQTVGYELAVPVSDYVAAMDQHYNEYAEDDRLYGDEQVEEPECTLRTLGWPPFSDVAAQHPLLFETFVRECQAFDSLHELFPRTELADQVRFLINSIDSVKLDGDLILLGGDAISLKS